MNRVAAIGSADPWRAGSVRRVDEALALPEIGVSVHVPPDANEPALGVLVLIVTGPAGLVSPG